MRLLAIVLCCFSLFGAETVSLHPVAPTSTDRISLHIPVPCPAFEQTVTRDGSVIRVRLSIDALCDPPATLPHVLDLEPLAPGAYRVEVRRTGDESIFAAVDFFVRNGANPPFFVHPTTVRTQPAFLRMRIAAAKPGESICAREDCSAVSIDVRGVPVTNIRADGLAATFDAPALPPGLYDVVLRREDRVATSIAAVAYFEELDPSLFERILFPVLDHLSGVNGSEWVSEAIVSNPRPWFVENANSVIPAVCVVFPCTERLFPRQMTSFEGMNYPHGGVLLAARSEAPDLAFSLRVRDLSRESAGFGTEIPVVREKDMFRNQTITLLGVPRDPRYRVKVRMYAVEPFFFPEVQRWRITTMDASGKKTVQFVTEDRQCADCPDLPAYFELDLTPGAKDEFSSIYIDPPMESFAWAFATVTNNATQQVTIVTPNGEGGEP